MTVLLKNNVSSTLATAITPSDTGLVVADGSRFPTITAGDYFYATLVSQAGQTEIVKVTARVGNSMTVARAQDGSSAASFQVGTLVDMRVNVASIAELRDEAGEITIADAGGYYTSGTVEGALQEAMTRANLAASAGSSLVGYNQGGTGAATRTVQSRLREVTFVEDFAPTANGTTDDRAVIQAAYDATPEGGWLMFGLKQQYRINSKLVFSRNVNVDFNNSTVILNAPGFPDNRHFDMLPNEPWANGRVPTTQTWTQTIGLGVRTFTVANSFSVGDTVAIHLGTDPYDSAEGHFIRVCKITAATALQFTVDTVTPYAVNGTTHRVIKINNPIENITIRNLNIDYVLATTPDTHVFIGFVSNCTFENFRAINSRILFNPYNSYNLTFRNIDAKVIRAGISSHGRIFAGWQLENVLIENVNGTSADRGSWFFWESWCRSIKHVNCQLIDSDSAATLPTLWVSGGSYDVEWDGVTIYPEATVDLLNSGGTVSDYGFRRLRMLKRPQFVDMRKVESFADVVSGVSFMSPASTVTNRAEGTLVTGVPGHRYVKIANGVLRRLWVYVESTTDLTAYIANNGGGVIAIHSELVAGQWKEISNGRNYGTLFGTNNPAFPEKTVQFFPGAAFPASAKFAVVAEYWPIDSDDATFRINMVEP
jgi:hypothetical protein